jgi:putative flavoprotein involved in K+ transport
MTLLGRLKGMTGTKLYFAADLTETLAKSDVWFASFKLQIDSFAREHGFESEADETSGPPPPRALMAFDQISELDASTSNITAILWAGGFRYDFSWIDLPVFDKSGEPEIRRGVSNWPGLYFLGLRRTYAVGSSLLAGVGDEAGYLAQLLASRS